MADIRLVRCTQPRNPVTPQKTGEPLSDFRLSDFPVPCHLFRLIWRLRLRSGLGLVRRSFPTPTSLCSKRVGRCAQRVGKEGHQKEERQGFVMMMWEEDGCVCCVLWMVKRWMRRIQKKREKETTDGEHGRGYSLFFFLLPYVFPFSCLQLGPVHAHASVQRRRTREGLDAGYRGDAANMTSEGRMLVTIRVLRVNVFFFHVVRICFPLSYILHLLWTQLH